MTIWICAACGVEYPQGPVSPEECPICLDERQYVPQSGQAWHSLAALSDDGHAVELEQLEPGLHGMRAAPSVGIGQRSLVLCTEQGNVLWDPVGFVDEAAAAKVSELGTVAAIVASHPHMYGAQVEWSRMLGNPPVYVAEADRGWVQREDACIRSFSGDLELLPSVTLRTLGGHFPGSAVAVWSAAADGRGVLLAGDTIFPGPDGRSVSFLRSYPNRLPLSAAVVERITSQALESSFERIYGNFTTVDADAHSILRESADRYIGWVRGDYDHLT